MRFITVMFFLTFFLNNVCLSHSMAEGGNTMVSEYRSLMTVLLYLYICSIMNWRIFLENKCWIAVFLPFAYTHKMELHKPLCLQY